MASSQHTWRFSRSGGFDQPMLDRAEDLKNLEHLDLKLWAALACPVSGLELDEKTLAMIDSDADGRVRAREVIDAVQWCEDHLKDIAAIKAGSSSVPLSQINESTANGKAMLACARQILKDLGRPAATEISLADVADTAKFFSQTNFNGDGIVPADAAGDEATKSALAQVIDCMGSATDRSGKPGTDQARVDAFYAQCAAFSEWAAKAETDAAIRPLGDATGAAVDASKAVRAKIDDYFARCKMAAFDGRSLAAVNRKEEEYLALAAHDLSISVSEIAGFPVAKVEAGKPLDLAIGVNPAWAAAMAAFRAAAVEPLLGKGKGSLTESEWTSICGKLGAFECWQGGKPATAVEKLGLARVRELVGNGSKDAIAKLIAQDKDLEDEFQAIANVERLVRYYRDLYRLLCNFVNFSDFYGKEKKATFQAGTLYLDQRACDLCVRVLDEGKHSSLAAMSKAYLAYCDLTRPSGEKMRIAAAFTGGDSDFLMVGRNGLFYDRQGRDWDATITKVIDNPISVRQAFWAPYKKFVRMIEEMAAKRAAAAEAEADAKLAAAAAATANADKTAAAAAKAEPKKIDVGAVAAMGVAFGAIGTLIAALVGGLMGLTALPFWQICIAVAGILLVISGPSMVIAWLKLRQRNMAPILDANGWAVNGRVRMNVPFGGSLTSIATLPPGSMPAVNDPFGEKKSAWPGLIKFAVIVCFIGSLGNHYGLLRKGLIAAGVAEDKVPGIFTKSHDERELQAIADKAKAEADAKAAAAKTGGDNK